MNLALFTIKFFKQNEFFVIFVNAFTVSIFYFEDFLF